MGNQTVGKQPEGAPRQGSQREHAGSMLKVYQPVECWSDGSISGAGPLSVYLVSPGSGSEAGSEWPSVLPFPEIAQPEDRTDGWHEKAVNDVRILFGTLMRKFFGTSTGCFELAQWEGTRSDAHGGGSRYCLFVLSILCHEKRVETHRRGDNSFSMTGYVECQSKELMTVRVNESSMTPPVIFVSAAGLSTSAGPLKEEQLFQVIVDPDEPVCCSDLTDLERALRVGLEGLQLILHRPAQPTREADISS